MGVIQRINTLQELSDKGDNSTDVTVEQLVIGALEEAFINMVKFCRIINIIYFTSIDFCNITLGSTSVTLGSTSVTSHWEVHLSHWEVHQSHWEVH